MKHFLASVAAALALIGAASAQTTGVISPAEASPPTELPPIAGVEPAAESAPTSETIRIPAGTIVLMEFAETLSSRSSLTGQLVSLRLAEPIMVEGRLVADVGAPGGGEVIDAARSGIGGRNGKLIVSGRYLELAGQRVRIRGLQVVIAGEDNSRMGLLTGGFRLTPSTQEEFERRRLRLWTPRESDETASQNGSN